MPNELADSAERLFASHGGKAVLIAAERGVFPAALWACGGRSRVHGGAVAGGGGRVWRDGCGGDAAAAGVGRAYGADSAGGDDAGRVGAGAGGAASAGGGADGGAGAAGGGADAGGGGGRVAAARDGDAGAVGAGCGGGGCGGGGAGGIGGRVRAGAGGRERGMPIWRGSRGIRWCSMCGCRARRWRRGLAWTSCERRGRVCGRCRWPGRCRGRWR